MSKSMPLTPFDMSRFQLHSGIENFIQELNHQLRVSPEGIRVLDWGCGRGRSVAYLRNKGYSVFGVDVDPIPLRNASEYFQEKEWDPENTLRILSDHGNAPFDNGYFHSSFSDQVFEHVKDLESVARELFRVSAPGSAGLHIFPSFRTVLEPHLFMPFVHWLPKNGWMKLAIRFFLALGLDPKWPELEVLDNRRKMERLFTYCIEKTYYRSPQELLLLFKKAGFQAQFVLSKRTKGWLSKIPRTGFITQSIIWVRSRFFMTELLLQKPGVSRV